MRNRFFILLTALFVLAGCGASAEKQLAKTLLEKECQQANKILAGKYVDALTLCTSCEFDGKNVIYALNDEHISRILALGTEHYEETIGPEA